MEQEVVSTHQPSVAAAVQDLCAKLKRSVDSYQAVIFMAAITYDFAELSRALRDRFPNSEVLGTSTAGEISPAGFAEGSIVLTTMYSSESHVAGAMVENGSTYPVSGASELRGALQRCGIRCKDPSSGKNAFAITFINGVFNAEESVLSTFYSIIQNDAFPLAGGTAGYTGDTPRTFISYNGKVTQDGAVFLFVRTSCPFDIRQEDIFHSTGKSFFVTEANPVERTLTRLNGRPAQTVYAEMLGVSESKATQMTFENPFGRYLDGELRIAALAGFTPDRKISLFARVVPNSTLELMHIGDPLVEADKTCSGIRAAIARPKFTLLMTCITRTLAFARMGISRNIISKYADSFPTFCGFSCYGEQIGRIHCNQTLVTVTIGE